MWYEDKLKFWTYLQICYDTFCYAKNNKDSNSAVQNFEVMSYIQSSCKGNILAEIMDKIGHHKYLF
jgi:hypothetical protein